LTIEYSSSRCYRVWAMLHFFVVPHVHTQSNQVCNNFHVIVLFLMLPRDYIFRYLYITTAGVNCCILHFSVLIFYGPSGSLSTALLSVKNWVTLKSVLGGVMVVALFSLSYVQTQSNRICNFHVMLFLIIPRVHYFQIFIQLIQLRRKKTVLFS
jgi:hypothetical protein